MTNKTYRTAMGKVLDLGELQLRNQNVRAVGNMNVNARGDLIDENDNVIVPAEVRVSQGYQTQTVQQKPKSNVVDSAVPTSKKQINAQTVTYGNQLNERKYDNEVKTALDGNKVTADYSNLVVGSEFETEFGEPAPKSGAEKPTGGLAAALAKSKTVQQEQLKTPRQTARSGPGVRRI